MTTLQPKHSGTHCLADEDDETERNNRKLVQASAHAIGSIVNPSEVVQLLAVQKNGNSLAYIESPSLQVQMAGVEEDSRAVRFIKNPHVDVQMKATSIDGYALQFIDNPSKMVQRNAIEQCGSAIRYVDEPDAELQLLAVASCGSNLIWIPNRTANTIAKAIETTPLIVFDDDFCDILTPEVLDSVYPSCAAQVGLIKTLSDDTTVQATLLAAFIAQSPGRDIQARTDAGPLPDIV